MFTVKFSTNVTSKPPLHQFAEIEWLLQQLGVKARTYEKKRHAFPMKNRTKSCEQPPLMNLVPEYSSLPLSHSASNFCSRSSKRTNYHYFSTASFHNHFSTVVSLIQYVRGTSFALNYFSQNFAELKINKTERSCWNGKLAKTTML